MTPKPIGEVIEDFARDIIAQASEDGVLLPQKLDAFSKVTAYFVGIHKVGAQDKNVKGAKTFQDMKEENKNGSL